MDILTTMQELQQYTLGSPLTIGRVTIHRKKTGQLHQGHWDLLQYAKANCDRLIVFFWSWEPVVNTIYSTRQAPEDQTWDESYCTSFCASAGADAVWIPDYNIHNQFQIVDWDAQRTLAEGIMTTEGYDIEADYDRQLVTSNIALREKYKQAMIYKVDRLFDSWKDGYFMFCLKHYTNNYTSQIMDVTAPSLDPATGIPYSSAYDLLTQDSITYINDVKALVDANLDLDLNFWPDKNNNVDIETVLPSEFWPYEHTGSNWFHIETRINNNILGTGKKYIRLLCVQANPFATINIPYYFDI